MRRLSLNWIFTALFLGAVLVASPAYAEDLLDIDVDLTGTHRILSLSDDEDGFQYLLATLLIEDFESSGEWSSFIARDYGLSMAMRRQGSPIDVTNDNNNYVLGVKTEFMRRDFSWLTITPAQGVAIKGVTKTLSVWIAGRGYTHQLSFIIRDYIGDMKTLPSDDMTHIGWKEVELQIPTTIDQENYKISDERGITFEGFRIDFDPEDMMGRPFYIYFDWMTSETDIFNEGHGNEDDMLDNW